MRFTLSLGLVVSAMFTVMAQSVVRLDQLSSHYTISHQGYVLTDTMGHFTAQDLGKDYFEKRFQAQISPVPNHGYSSATVWLKVSLYAATAQEWLLEVDNSRLNVVRCFLMDGSRLVWQQTLGDARSFKSYPISNRAPVFALPLQAHRLYTLYLQATTTEDLKFPLTLWQPKSFYRHVADNNLIWGIYFGFILLIALYNLLLWFTVREAIFINYFLYVLSFGMFQFSLYGFGFQYVWDNAPFNDYSHIFFIGLMTIFFTYFSIQFLGIFKELPHSKKFFSVVAWGWLLLFLASLYFYNPLTNVIIIGAGALMILLQQFYCFTMLFRGQRSARLYLIATAPLSVSILVVGMMNLGWLPAHRQEYYLMAGSMLEITLFSMALGDRLRMAQREQERMLRVRNEIAANLHDDLAASLSSLTMYSELNRLKSQKNAPELATLFGNISHRSREAMKLVRETVWEINPQNDQSEEWLDRIRQFAQDILEAKQINFILDFDPALQKLRLPIDERRHLFLFFKEALNNIAKHAQAQNVSIELRLTNEDLRLSNPTLQLIIKDDGIGFNPDNQPHGNGIRNFEMRAKALHGQFELSSATGQGTNLSLRFKVVPIHFSS